MIYISYGMPKSASSFFFQILDDAVRLYAENAGGEFYGFEAFVDQPLSSSFVPMEADFDAVVRQLIERKGAGPENSTVIKTHSPCTPYIRSLIESGVVFANASFRHPADCALSLIDSSRKDRAMGGSRFPEVDDPGAAMPHIVESVQHFLTWVTERTLLTSFDDIAFDTPAVLARLEAQIGVRMADGYLQERFPDNTAITEFNAGKKDRRLGDMNEEWRSYYDTVFADFIGLMEGWKRG
ncbi:MAG: hypothetical protein ACTSV1_05740 [Alphaproteobacteria bacterium]